MDDYDRVEVMSSYMNNTRSQMNTDAEGFSKGDITTNGENAYHANSFSGIKGNQSQTVLLKPCLGLLKQINLIPLRYAPFDTGIRTG